MDDHVAAADGELRGHADRDLGRLRLSIAGGGSRCLKARRRRGTAHAEPALAHHFDNLEQQREAATLGMWVFLVTEVLFFGGLFVVYAVYRSWYPEAFAAASHELDVMLGGINTAVLIASSLTMALAVHAAQTGKRSLVMLFLIADDGRWAACSWGSSASSTTISSPSITFPDRTSSSRREPASTRRSSSRSTS